MSSQYCLSSICSGVLFFRILYIYFTIFRISMLPPTLLFGQCFSCLTESAQHQVYGTCLARGVKTRESWVLWRPERGRGGRQHPKKKPAARDYFPPASFAARGEKVGQRPPTAARDPNVLWRKKNAVLSFNGTVRRSVEVLDEPLPRQVNERPFIFKNMIF